MGDNVLTQEEIDTLLTSISKGEVDLEEKGRAERDARPYELVTQYIRSSDELNVLEEIYEKFVNRLQTTLSTSLQKKVTIEAGVSETLKYSGLIQRFEPTACFVVFNMEPLIGSAVLVIEPALVFVLIDCLFGGSGKPLVQTRDFTAIELRMMQKFSDSLLADYASAWQLAERVAVHRLTIETKPDDLQITGPGDLVVTRPFSVSGDTFAERFHLCLPQMMLEQCRDKLSNQCKINGDVKRKCRNRLENLLLDTPVTVTVELGRTLPTVRELLHLKVNDIIKLENGPEDLVNLQVEKISKYQGLPGIVKGNRAVQINNKIAADGRYASSWINPTPN